MEHKHGRKIPVNGGDRESEEGREEEVSEAEALKAELDKARAEAKESQDKYLRLYADTENFRKRMGRESVEREKYYNENLLKDFLPVLDNLDRALTHAGEGTGNEGLVEGVRMVRKQFMDVLAKFGVTKVESVGLPFDPNSMQAMMHAETDEYEPGTVVEEFQKGYFLNDRILRPAMVTVAKRPPEKEPSGPTEEQA